MLDLWSNFNQVQYSVVTLCTGLPKLAKVRQDSTGVEVVSDHATSRSQTGPNVRLDNKPRLHSLFGQ